mgnify:CR=1 FL=1
MLSLANINLAGKSLTSGLAHVMLEVLARYKVPSFLIINKPGSQNISLSASLIDFEI